MSEHTPHIIIYGFEGCTYCTAAKRFFESRHLTYTYYEAKLDEAKREEMLRVGKGKTYPQIIINGIAIGGYSDLMELHNNQQLNSLLTGEHHD